MKNLSYKIVIITVLFLAGCKHSKKIVGTKTEPVQETVTIPVVTQPGVDANVQALMKQAKSNELPFKELSAKMKTKVTSSSLNQSFTTNIRWKKGEKIWLSMSIIGIEGARVLITKDSIKIMDKINNRYILKPLSYIKQKALVDLSFSDIENIFLGQLIFVDSTKSKYADNATNLTITSDGIRFLTSVLFDKNTRRINNIFVTDKKYTQTVEASYSNYQVQLGKPFAMDRELKMKNAAESFEMILKFQSIEAKQNLEYPFTINPNYKIEK